MTTRLVEKKGGNMVITVKGRTLDIGMRKISNTILDERMSHDCPPVGTIIQVASNARMVVTSATTVCAENIDEEGRVTATRDNTMTADQMLKVRDLWAINEASMPIEMG